MKHEVLTEFIDKESGDYFAPGSFYTSEEFERVKELEEKGYIKANDSVSSLNSDDEPTVKELKAKAKELGLEGYSKLSKDELIALIESAEKVGDDNAGEN